MIYFLRPVEGGPIKIGTTENLEVRHKQLEAHYGRELAVLGVRPGNRETEREIHERFAHLRLGRTEQFRPGPDLMEFIGRPLLVGANPDAAEAMAGEKTDIRLRVDSEFHGRVEAAADEDQMTIAAFIRALIVKELKRREKGGEK